MGWGVLKPRACSSSEFMFSMHRLHRRLIFIYPEWASYLPLPNFWYWPATIFCFVPPNCSPVASDRPDQDRGCSAEPVVTTNHINVEGWTESYASTWAEIERDYPQNAPRNLGNMGEWCVFPVSLHDFNWIPWSVCSMKTFSRRSFLHPKTERIYYLKSHLRVLKIGQFTKLSYFVRSAPWSTHSGKIISHIYIWILKT